MRRLGFVYVMALFLLSACAGGDAWQPVESDATRSPQTLAVPGTYDPLTQGGLGPFAAGGAAFRDNNMTNVPPVRVAILLPLSGQNRDIGQTMLKAAQLALFDLGADTFELLPKDTHGTAEGARKAAEDAVNEGAQLILGPLFTESVAAVQPVASRANLNVISFSTDWTLASNNNVYLMGFMPFNQVRRAVAFGAQQGMLNMVLITKPDAYGLAVENSFMNAAKAHNITVPRVIRLGGDTLTNESLTLLKTMLPDAVFIALNGKDAVKISAEMDRFGINKAIVKRIGTGQWDDDILAQEATMDSAWFAAPPLAQRRIFEEKYTELYGAPPLRLATLSYDATALAAVLAKRGAVNRNDVYVPAYNSKTLRNTNGFGGVDGAFRFNNHGLIERQLSILEFKDGIITERDPAASSF